MSNNFTLKMKDTYIYILSFVVTTYIQDKLIKLNLFSLDNLFFDFLSWIIIFFVVYVILKGIESIVRQLKNNK